MSASDPDLDLALQAAVDWIAPLCRSLPEVVEELAWIGTRWRVRGKTFAHVLPVVDGAPGAFARAIGTDDSNIVLTFRSEGPELDALAGSGHPYFTANWGRPVGGLIIDDGTDRDEVRELVTESYCLLAPAKLRDQVERPEG